MRDHLPIDASPKHKELRRQIEDTVEALITMLDEMDGDPEQEHVDEREGVVGGYDLDDERDDSDFEPQCEDEGAQCEDEGADQGDECGPNFAVSIELRSVCYEGTRRRPALWKI